MTGEVERKGPVEDVFGVTHGVTPEQAIGFIASQFRFFDEAYETIQRLLPVVEQKEIEASDGRFD